MRAVIARDRDRARSGSAKDGAPPRADLRRARGADQPLRERARRARRAGRRPGVHAARAGAGAARRGARRAEARRGRVAAVLGVRTGADPPAHAARRRPGARHVDGAVPAQGRSRSARELPRPRARAARRRTRRRDVPGAHELARAARGGEPRVRDPSDRARPARAAALHERHDRHARRARCTCTRRSSRTTPPRGSRSISAPTTCSGAPPIPAG